MQFSIKVLLFFTAWIAFVMGAVIAARQSVYDPMCVWPTCFVAYATGLVTIVGIIVAICSKDNNRPFWIGFAAVCAVMFFSGRMPDFTPDVYKNEAEAIPYLSDFVTRYCGPRFLSKSWGVIADCIARTITYGIVPIAGLAGGLITQWWVLRITKKGNPKS